jgi:hypothetical protein
MCRERRQPCLHEFDRTNKRLPEIKFIAIKDFFALPALMQAGSLRSRRRGNLKNSKSL